VHGQVAGLSGGWVRINSPQYAAGEGSPTIASHVVPEQEQSRIYVTNGQTVRESTNAGCNWDHVYPAPSQAPDARAANHKVAVLAAPSATVLWVASYDNDGGVPRPHVEVSTDASPRKVGTTAKPFVAIDRGLPVAGTPVAIAPSSFNKQRAFLLVEGLANPAGADGGPGAARSLYRLVTDDQLAAAGLSLSWEQVTAPAGFDRIGGMAMDPNNAVSLWIWSGSKYAHTSDGGTTWDAVAAAPGPVTALDVDRHGLAVVFAKAPDGPTAFPVVSDGRGHYSPGGSLGVPTTVNAVAHGFRSGVYVVSGDRGTFGYDTSAARWVNLNPPRVPQFADVQLGSDKDGRVLLGRYGGALYRWDLFPNEAFLPPPRGLAGDGDYGDVPKSGINHPFIHVQHPEVTVKPGEAKPDKVDFGLDPSPSPLEVYFLMDTTTSMEKSIDGLKAGVNDIAAELKRRTHGKACFGVGEFKDEGLVNANEHVVAPYRRVLPITCESELTQLHTAVDQLHEGAGNTNQREAQTIGLTQAVKNEPQVNPPVTGDQRAGFSPGHVTRVIVLITDAGFMTSYTPYTFPTIDQTVQTLNAFETNVVGVVVRDGNREDWATEDVTRVVSGTHTLAPDKGVDCDGDGFLDLQPGDPLVCKTSGDAPKIAPSIIGLLLGVKDRGTVAVGVEDPHHVVKSVDGDLSALRNLKIESHLPFTLHLACSAEQDGLDLPVTLHGTRRGSLAAEATIVVHCRGVKIVPPVKPRPPLPEPDPPIIVKAPIVPVLLPQFQPPPVNNPPANINPNAGFSQQEEQQFQVATVTQGAAEEEQQDEEVELAMSALHHDDAAAASMVLGCAMFVGVAGAVAVAQRRRTQRSLRAAYNRLP
jgi:hypothetical protein